METIMVQEPDEATLEVLTAALQMEGYRVWSLADPDENILEMIGKHHPKLVLLDYRLNPLSGKRICEWIKAHFPRLPLIALSCDHTIGRQYRSLGFTGYLKKPFDLELLYRVVRRHLHRIKRPRLNEVPTNK